MNDIRLAHAVTLVTDRADNANFQIGLDGIESRTGRLLPTATTEFDGDGTAFRECDLLFGKLRPYLAKTWLADRDGSAVGDFLVLRTKEIANAKYVSYILRSEAFLSAVTASATGAKMPRTDWRTIKNSVVRLPSFDEQRAIADYLDHETAQIDALVAKQEEFIGLLRQRSRAIRRNALAPAEGWNATKIKHLAQTSLGKMLDGGRAPRDGDFTAPYVRAADILSDGTVRLNDLKEMSFSARELRYLNLRKNDILIAEGGSAGRPGILRNDAPEIAFQKTVNRLRPGPDLDPHFAYWSLLELYESDYYPNYFGAVSFVHLTAEKLREISLDHPSIDEQRRIGRLISDQTSRIDALIAKAEELIALAKERRSALITAAVTGRIDVRTAPRKAG